MNHGTRTANLHFLFSLRPPFPITYVESAPMFVFLLPEGGQMFARKLPNTPGMFAWGFAIF